MFLRWIKVGTQSLVGLALILSINQKHVLFFPAKIIAVGLFSCCLNDLWALEKAYIEAERNYQTIQILKIEQIATDLERLQESANLEIREQTANREMARQLDMLQSLAVIFQDMMQLAGGGGAAGAVQRMTLGSLLLGKPIGEALIDSGAVELEIQQAQLLATASQPRQETVVIQPNQQSPQLDQAVSIERAASSAGIQVKHLRTDKAPSHVRLIFNLGVEDSSLLPKWKSATKLALGVEHIPMYIHGPEQVAVEIPLKAEERTFCEFPQMQWQAGGRIIPLGSSLDGEIEIDLASEDTPQVLVVGTTGSGKSNFLRSCAYSLLRQGAQVDICGGKVSDYEDFPPRFPGMDIDGNPATKVSAYYAECGRRNALSKAELAATPTWALIIDEYRGTVPLDENPKKTYDQQLCEVARRGRGLKIHIIIGLQRGSLRSKQDPQGLPPDLRSNLPCRIAFRCVSAIDGRLILNSHGENVTSLQGKGDGIIQSGLLDARFQAYKFFNIPL